MQNQKMHFVHKKERNSHLDKSRNSSEDHENQYLSHLNTLLVDHMGHGKTEEDLPQAKQLFLQIKLVDKEYINKADQKKKKT